MLKPKESSLKRCTVCRRWYHPSIKATRLQRTCSETCRLRRRRRLARARRERNLQDYRVDERERQRLCRRRRKKTKPAGGALPPPSSVEMSRAGLRPQALDLHRIVRESVDTALHRSRATLIRQLTASLADKSSNPGQTFFPEVFGHAPACVHKCVPELK
jgi:hypothetical protein